MFLVVKYEYNLCHTELKMLKLGLEKYEHYIMFKYKMSKIKNKRNILTKTNLN